MTGDIFMSSNRSYRLNCIEMLRGLVIVGCRLSLLLVFSLAVPSGAYGDSWVSPMPKTYASERGTYRLTVYPAARSRILASTRAEAVLEKLDGKSYVEYWRRSLDNKVAPVDVLVSEHEGRFVTFDNWSAMGHGDNAVVVYDGRGEVVRKLALTDFLSKATFENLPSSVSSIHWRKNVQLWMLEDAAGQRQEVVEMTTHEGPEWPEPCTDSGGQVTRIRLSDGRVVP